MYNPDEIKTIVTVQYCTPDGVLHETIAEALRHTPSPPEPEYEMWASNKRDGIFDTEDIDQAAIVFLPHAHAVEDFINDSQTRGCIDDGIDGPGWYTWDADNCAWVLAPVGTDSLFEKLRF